MDNLKNQLVDGIIIDRLVRCRRRSLGLVITPDARLVVRVPWHASTQYIRQVVLDKREWILKTQRTMRERQAALPVRRFMAGEEYLLLGTPYLLTTSADTFTPEIRDNRLLVADTDADRLKRQLLTWYKHQARRIVPERVAHYAGRVGVEFRKVGITNAARRWGSCGSRDTLNFSWRLVMAPLEIIDYVVVHELAHVAEKNHGKRFWKRVAEVVPDFKARKKWLRVNGPRLTL